VREEAWATVRTTNIRRAGWTYNTYSAHSTPSHTHEPSRITVAVNLKELEFEENPDAEYTGAADNTAQKEAWQKRKEAWQTTHDNNIELAKLAKACYDEGAPGFNHALRIPRCNLKKEIHRLEKHEKKTIDKMPTDNADEKKIKTGREKDNNRAIEVAKAKLGYFEDSL